MQHLKSALIWQQAMKSPSKWAWVIVVLVYAGICLMFQPWHRSNFIREDVVSYYAYLPAVWVHQDVGMHYSAGNAYYGDKVWGEVKRPGLGPVSKYTMGMAFLYTPGFLMGHLHAKWGGWTADGYTMPYRLWMQINILAYLALGLIVLRRLLLGLVGEWATALTLLGLGLATNLFYYVVAEPGMPHATLFMLVSAFMWFTVRFRVEATWSHALYLGLTGGLICLIRPNHAVLWALPLLYGFRGGLSWREGWRFWWGNKGKVALMLVLPVILFIPQLLYWKHSTGEFLHYSYGDEGFFWLQPKMMDLLFSFRKGLFLYTPLALVACVGFLWGRKHTAGWGWAGPLVLGITAYVMAAWWCWWYGGSLGQRAFIDVFPMLAVGLAAFFVRFVVDRQPSRRVWAGALIGLLCAWNGILTLQYQRGVLHHDAMTARAFLGTLGKLNPPIELESWLDHPDYEAAKQSR